MYWSYKICEREVRLQIVAKLELPEDGTICAIGAGCGSIGLEALKLRPNLKLFCIDKRIGSKELISENARRLGVTPTDILEEDINNMFISHNKNPFIKSFKMTEYLHISTTKFNFNRAI